MHLTDPTEQNDVGEAHVSNPTNSSVRQDDPNPKIARSGSPSLTPLSIILVLLFFIAVPFISIYLNLDSNEIAIAGLFLFYKGCRNSWWRTRLIMDDSIEGIPESDQDDLIAVLTVIVAGVACVLVGVPKLTDFYFDGLAIYLQLSAAIDGFRSVTLNRVDLRFSAAIYIAIFYGPPICLGIWNLAAIYVPNSPLSIIDIYGVSRPSTISLCYLPILFLFILLIYGLFFLYKKASSIIYGKEVYKNQDDP